MALLADLCPYESLFLVFFDYDYWGSSYSIQPWSFWLGPICLRSLMCFLETFYLQKICFEEYSLTSFFIWPVFHWVSELLWVWLYQLLRIAFWSWKLSLRRCFPIFLSSLFLYSSHFVLYRVQVWALFTSHRVGCACGFE